jgi:hypothetical protein
LFVGLLGVRPLDKARALGDQSACGCRNRGRHDQRGSKAHTMADCHSGSQQVQATQAAAYLAPIGQWGGAREVLLKNAIGAL